MHPFVLTQVEQQEEAIVNYVGPHGGALIFRLESASGGAAFASGNDQLDDDFFDLKLEDVKVRGQPRMRTKRELFVLGF